MYTTGGVTNWIAVEMLFKSIPYVIGTYVLYNIILIREKKLQWNLHKTDTIGEQPFGRYRKERFREPTTVCSVSQFLHLGALLTASLAHTSFEKAVACLSYHDCFKIMLSQQ